MLYLLDTADVRAIARCADLFPLAGVTTNPTLVAREKRPLLDLLTEIRAIIGEHAMLHAQVMAPDAETMFREAACLCDRFGPTLYPKLPVTPQGLKAIRLLASAGFSVTATAIAAPQQALLAARAGAAFTAPYVNRICKARGDGPGVVSQMVHLFSTFGLPTRVLAASFMDVQQIHSVAMAGAHAATMSPDLLEQVLAHPLTESSVAGFNKDWAAAFGSGTTILDLIPAAREYPASSRERELASAEKPQ